MLREVLATLALAGIAMPAIAQSYTIEPRHSHINWAVNHAGGLTFRGKMVRNTGKIMLDPAAGKGDVQVVVDIGAQVTGNELDRNLMIPSLFNAAVFPTATFKSSKVTFNGQTPARIEGDLTMLGVTKPVTLTVTQFHCGEHPFSRRNWCGADATATILRGNWGMTGWTMLAGDEVKLDIGIEAYRD